MQLSWEGIKEGVLPWYFLSNILLYKLFTYRARCCPKGEGRVDYEEVSIKAYFVFAFLVTGCYMDSYASYLLIDR